MTFISSGLIWAKVSEYDPNEAGDRKVARSMKRSRKPNMVVCI